jgi:hypothetical protein
MDSSVAAQLSQEFESALSEILPDLHQVLQRYKVQRVLGISLEIPVSLAVSSLGCMLVWNAQLQKWEFRCNFSNVSYATNRVVADKPSDDTLGLDADQEKQFCNDISLILGKVLSRLAKPIEKSGESFEVQFLLDPATLKSAEMVCKWDGNILQCS